MVINATFVLGKTTKNAVMFEEEVPVGQPEQVGNWYLKKWAWEGIGSPQRVTMQVEAVNGG